MCGDCCPQRRDEGVCARMGSKLCLVVGGGHHYCLYVSTTVCAKFSNLMFARCIFSNRHFYFVLVGYDQCDICVIGRFCTEMCVSLVRDRSGGPAGMWRSLHTRKEGGYV